MGGYCLCIVYLLFFLFFLFFFFFFFRSIPRKRPAKSGVCLLVYSGHKILNSSKSFNSYIGHVSSISVFLFVA